MKISQRNMSNEEIFIFFKNFFKKNEIERFRFTCEIKDSSIIIYDIDLKRTHIINGTEKELTIIKSFFDTYCLYKEYKTEDLISFLQVLNNTEIYLIQNIIYDSLMINKYLDKSDLSNTILNNIYILKNNILSKITEKDFENNHNKIDFINNRETFGYDFFIILDEDFNFTESFSFNKLNCSLLISFPYCFFNNSKGLAVADLLSNPKLNFLNPIPNSNFFYEIIKNKIIIYQYNDKLEYFSEIKIKEYYTNIEVKYFQNKISLSFGIRDGKESVTEFYLISNEKNLSLVFKHKENKTAIETVIYTTNKEEIKFKSLFSDYYDRHYPKADYIVNYKFGFLIEKNLENMYYNGRKIKLIDNYNIENNFYSSSITFLQNGLVINDIYITYEGEILPIKSFIPENTLILSIIKSKTNKGIGVTSSDIDSYYKAIIFKLKTKRIDKNIEGYKNKLNKEILKEFTKL